LLFWRRIVALRRRLAGDSGTSFVELSIAMGVLSVAVLGVVGTMGLGMSLTGASRQRSSASAIAVERLERSRNAPYDRLATYEQPTHSGDATSPDYKVSTDNTQYQVTGGTNEPLIVDTVNGALKHLDDPTTVGNTQFSVYQYVTWVDDPQIPGTQDYKRVTVVVIWKYPVHTGTSHTITQSTFVSPGSVTLPNATPTAGPTSSPSPTPTAAPTPTPGPCEGDHTAPSGGSPAIFAPGTGDGTGFTNSRTVTVQLKAIDSCTSVVAELSSDNFATPPSTTTTLTPGTPPALSGSPSFQVAAGDGAKTIYVRFRDGANNVSSVYSTTITLDTVVPAAPGTLAKSSCNISSSTRTINMSWGASTPRDTNFSAYRVYQQLNGGAWIAIATPSGTTYNDNPPGTRKQDAVQYKVRAYDKAGNESGDSNVISSAAQKNPC